MTDSFPATAATEGTTMTTTAYKPCPDGAVLVIKGESFPCDWMRHMAPECETHEGWAHGNSDAEAIWQ